ncbi:MAG: DUF790 family protein [Planctomycetes bacterium]|nr:DUF790 family protein [Planctomycetota bacterium]
MLPKSLIQHGIQGHAIQPHYLLEADYPWLYTLIELYESFIGRKRRELRLRLLEPLHRDVPVIKYRTAVQVLNHLSKDCCKSRVSPKKARSMVFEAAAGGGTPEEVIAKVAKSLGVKSSELRESLFADLSDERCVVALPNPFSPSELALRSNLAMVQSLLRQALRVRIDSEGNSRAIVRHAKLWGLLCQVMVEPLTGKSILEVSGPYTILKKTILYGRALAGLVPLLAWCDRFTLTADCALGNKEFKLMIRSGDPIFPAAEPKRFDSRLEERFSKDFLKAAPDWELIREPEPIEACGTLIFPDFLLRHRYERNRSWLLEIAGFWTSDYLDKKLQTLKAAGLSNLILCINEEKNCGEEALHPETRVLRFKRKIDMERVLKIISKDSLH